MVSQSLLSWQMPNVDYFYLLSIPEFHTSVWAILIVSQNSHHNLSTAFGHEELRLREVVSLDQGPHSCQVIELRLWEWSGILMIGETEASS